jgi:hypothetical protein
MGIVVGLARSLVALALAVVVPTAAWAACGPALPFSAAGTTCRMPAEDHCNQAQGAGDLPDCCKVKKATLQPIVLIAPPATPDGHRVLTAGAVVGDTLRVPAAQAVLDRAVRSPLKLPGDPTYLRISVLLI